MAQFYAVFNRREQSGKQVEGRSFAEGKLSPQSPGAALLEYTTGQLEDACVLKVEATNTTTAKQVVLQAYPGLVTGNMVVVPSANFKEI